MSRIAVIADQYTADVFQLTDFDVEIADEKNVLEKITEKLGLDYSVIYISDILTENITENLNEIKQSTKAIIVIIPGVGSKQLILNKEENN